MCNKTIKRTINLSTSLFQFQERDLVNERKIFYCGMNLTQWTVIEMRRLLYKEPT